MSEGRVMFGVNTGTRHFRVADWAANVAFLVAAWWFASWILLAIGLLGCAFSIWRPLDRIGTARKSA